MTKFVARARSTRWLCVAVEVSLLFCAVGPGWAAQPLDEPVQVLPGTTLEALRAAEPARRAPWCNMAEHIAKLQPVPLAEDPLFRRPTPIVREKLAAVSAMHELARNRKDLAMAKRQLKELFASADGPVLARLSMQSRANGFRAAAMELAVGMAGQHPRLASFAGQDVRHSDPQLATAAVKVLLASRCDTSASYALDGLGHPDPAVRRAVISGVFAADRQMLDMGLMAKVVAHVTGSEADVVLASRAVRHLGQIAWVPGSGALTELLNQPKVSRALRCEASVALARMTSRVKTEDVRVWAKAADPWSRMCAIRMAAAGLTGQRAAATTVLRPLLKDRRDVVDPLVPGLFARGKHKTKSVGGAGAKAKRWRVDEAAKLALSSL